MFSSDSSPVSGKAGQLSLLLSMIQTIGTIVVAVAMILLLILAVPTVSRITQTADNVNEAITQVRKVLEDVEVTVETLQPMTADAQQAVERINIVSGELKDADLPSLISDSKEAVVQAGEAMELVLKKLDTLDIETLNTAIGNFSDVVEPLARFFNVFQKN